MEEKYSEITQKEGKRNWKILKKEEEEETALRYVAITSYHIVVS